MTVPDEVAAAVEDARFPPAGYFIAAAVVVAAGIGLSVLHPVLFAVAPAGMLAIELLRRKAGHAVTDRQHLIVMNAPFPGVMAPTLAATGVVVGAGFIAIFVADSAPAWTIVALGAVAGVTAAALWRRAELRTLTAIRRLETSAGSDGIRPA